MQGLHETRRVRVRATCRRASTGALVRTPRSLDLQSTIAQRPSAARQTLGSDTSYLIDFDQSKYASASAIALRGDQAIPFVRAQGTWAKACLLGGLLYRQQHAVIPRNLIDEFFTQEYVSSKMPIKTDILVTQDQYDKAKAEVEGPILNRTFAPDELHDMRCLSPLSETELIEQVIEFANTGNPSSFALLWTGVRMPSEALARAHSVLSDESQPPIWIERVALQEDLAAIVEEKVTREIRVMWHRHAEGLVLQPTFNDDGSVRYRYAVLERFRLPPSPPLAYAQLLLLRGAQLGELCQCKLEGCRKFFLAARPIAADGTGEHRGRPIRDYCPGTDHRDLAHRAAGAERVRRSRARVKARAAINQKRRR